MVRTLSCITNARVDAAQGLGAILCYDPYFTRMLRGVKKALVDGNPVMIRLHPGARHDAPLDQVYRIDLESHAVLIVGYDDYQSAVAIADPWLGAVRWLTYEELSLSIVNSTKDCIVIATPLDVACSVVERGESTNLEIRVGFYRPDSIVMDHEGQSLTDVRVSVMSAKGWSPLEKHAELSGSWRVGEYASLLLAAPPGMDGMTELKLEVSATVRGERPYRYSDTISTEVTRRVSLPRKRQAVAV